MLINDLPNEILQLIFKVLVAAPTPLLPSPPSRVAEVCQLWHSQALLVPEIFNILPFISLTSRSDVPRRLLTTEGPLSFAMSWVCSLRQENANLKRIIRSAAQWEHAELLEFESIFPTATLQDFSCGFPLLHTLKLQISDLTHSSFNGRIQVFKHAHSLRHLELECSQPLVFEAPFEQLVEYVERSSIAIAVRKALSPQSQIQSVSFKSLHPVPLPYNINLPKMEEVARLTSLNLYIQPETVRFLLCRLTLPSLARLRVVSSSPNIVKYVKGLVSRSRCPLETLSLRSLEGMDWDVIPSDAVMEDPTPLLCLCPQLRKLELDRLNMHTLQNIIHPSAPTFLPQLQEFIAHLPFPPSCRFEIPFDPPGALYNKGVVLPNAPPPPPMRTRGGAPDHDEGRSIRRVPFVRLIFRSAQDRAMAHLRAEGFATTPDKTLALDSKLIETTHFLHSSCLTEPLRSGPWWKISAPPNEPSSRLDQALSNLEADVHPMNNPWQILLSRVYVPLNQLRQASSGPASQVGARKRVVDILNNFDNLFKKVHTEWKSENDVTLVRIGHPAPPTVKELLEAESIYPGSKRTPRTAPWGFVDLTRRIGSVE